MEKSTKSIIKELKKYLQIDLKYYIKNTFYLLSAEGVSRIFGLLLSIAFARLLSKEIYGQWNYIFSIVSIVAILTLPGINTSITQAVARGYDVVFVSGTKERLRWGAWGSLVLFAIGVYYFLNGSVLLGKCFMLSAIFMPFYESLQTYNAFLSGKKMFNRIAKYRTIAQACAISLTVSAIYLSKDLITILLVYLVSFSVIRGYLWKRTLRDIRTIRDDPRALSFGRHLTVMNIPGTISAWGDKVIIGLILSFPELAIYSIAKAYSTLVRSLLSPIATLTFPKLSTMSEEKAFLAVKKRYAYLVLLTALVCVIAIILCPYIIIFLYSYRYVDSVFYAQLLLLALVCGVPTTIVSKALFPAQRKIRELYLIRTRAFVELLLLVVLTVKFGLLGVVLAKLLANIFGMIYSWKLARWI